MRRSLTLVRETLTELTPGELGAVAGGTGPSVDESCPTLPVLFCVRQIVDPLRTTSCG